MSQTRNNPEALPARGTATLQEQETILLKRAGFLVGHNEAGGTDDGTAFGVRVRLGTAMGFDAITNRWSQTVKSFADVDVPWTGLAARYEDPVVDRRMTTTRAVQVCGAVTGSALDALWRFAGKPPTDETTTRAVEALGSFHLCLCGRHAFDGHRAAQSAQSLCWQPGNSVAVLHRWACRARLLVAFAAHLRLCRRGGDGRKWDAPIPCMGRQWTIEEAIIGVQGPGKADGVAAPDGYDVYSVDDDGNPVVSKPRNAARLYLEPLGQWTALLAAAQAWLSATRPQLSLKTCAPPAIDDASEEARKQRCDRAASLMTLGVEIFGNQDGICVAGLELANILEDVVEGRRCFNCRKPVILERRGTAQRPCCAERACVRERDRLQRRESQAKLKARQMNPDAVT